MVSLQQEMIEIEVAYAKPDRQVIIPLTVPAGTTAHQAIEQAEIVLQFPEINLTENKIGIFSQVCALDYVLNAHDRVEIYRPLCNDPKEARRLRASKKWFHASILPD